MLQSSSLTLFKCSICSCLVALTEICVWLMLPIDIICSLFSLLFWILHYDSRWCFLPTDSSTPSMFFLLMSAAIGNVSFCQQTPWLQDLIHVIVICSYKTRSRDYSWEFRNYRVAEAASRNMKEPTILLNSHLLFFLGTIFRMGSSQI